MLQIRKAADRGHANHGWLNSHHSFSFANYYDPAHMGWSALRVINDDTVSPGNGFGTHPHRDMEIISYVLEGELAHKDTLGTGSVIRPGDVQMMSAGTGIAHSEYNPSSTAPVHFLQVWIIPEKTGVAPAYQQRRIEDDEKRGKLRLVVSADGREDSLTLHQDASLYCALLDGAEVIEHAMDPARKGYVHVARGTLTVNGVALSAGDGARISEESLLRLEKGQQAEVLVFDLPPR